MEVDTIIEDYLGNRANKRRSIDSVHFELHWERDLMRLLDDINNRSLDPFLYSFIRQKPRPREVIAALMQMKIPQHHFDTIVRPLVEAELTDRTFNNRIGYGGDRTIRNCRMAIRKWNRLAYPSQLEHFLASINSFIGLMKHRNDYGKIRDLVDEVSPKWLKYCHYNDDRRCFEANEGYKHNDILIRKYGLKFNKLKHKNNDKTGN